MLSYTSYITRTDAKTGQMELPNGKRKIFISYKHSDEVTLPLCQKIAAYILERMDVAVWYDEFLTPGESFRENIEKMMKEQFKGSLLLLLGTAILLICAIVSGVGA